MEAYKVRELNKMVDMDKNNVPIPGKRYWFYIDNWTDRKKDGLFTGNFDLNNGNALLMSKNGDTWSIPVKDLHAGKSSFEEGAR